MFLEKWYGDFVNENHSEIHYLANLSFGPIIIAYRGKLGQSRSSTTAVRLRGFQRPVIKGSNLYWPVDGDKTELIWQNVQPRPQMLWQQGRERMIWEPMVLNGEVLSDQGHQGARGYAERLTLNFTPWRLGIKRLKWGRFCGRKQSLIWIEWIGRIPKKLALLNGEPVPLLRAETGIIETDTAQLVIASSRKIVHEALDQGALHALNGIRFFRLSQFLSGVEIKWVGNGVLKLNDTDDEGYVIYEEVRWE